MTGERVRLPDLPGEWGEVNTFAEGHFLQRWMPGAFGDRKDIAGVERFRVLREEFVECPEASERNPEGIPERTILEAVVMVVMDSESMLGGL